MKNRDLATQNYKRFCACEGSDFIASEFALETILRIISVFKVHSVLELGLGIGSISDTVLKFSKKENKKISYVGTEKNEFCLNAIKKNIIDSNHIELYAELNEIKNRKFDLIIIDGYDDNLKEIVTFCNKNTIIFIEGDRKGQTEAIVQIFPKFKHVNVITLNKNKSYVHGSGNSDHYVGGGQLIFINPTFKMILFWFQQKTATYIKNKVRTYKKQ